MKQLCLLLPLAALGALGAAGLATDYSEERSLSVVSESSFSLETTSFEMLRDGEPVEMPDGGPGGGSSETRRVEYVDTWLAGSDAGPTHVRRAFGDVEGEFELNLGGEDRTLDRESEWAGVILEFTLDEDGEVEIEVVEGDLPDQDNALEFLRPELFLDALLPQDADLDEGDSWELEHETIARGLGLDVESRLFPRLEFENREGEGGGRRRGAGGRQAGAGRVLAAAEWEGEATLTSLSDELDGQTCARIEISIEAEGDMEVPGIGGGRGGQGGVAEGTYSIELEGSLLFSLDERRPVLLELEGSLEATRHIERSFGESSMTMDTEQEGEFEITVHVTPHED